MSKKLLYAIALRALLLTPSYVSSQEIVRKGNYADADDLQFSIEKWNDIKKLVALRNYAIRESIRVLNHSDDKETAAMAAKLLGEMRANDEEAIDTLCNHLTLLPEITVLPHPMGGYVSAQALVEIGDVRVIDAVLRVMERKLTQLELLLCMQIVDRIDTHASIRERIKRHEDGLRAANRLDVQARLKDNAAQIEHWRMNPAESLLFQYGLANPRISD